MKGSPEERKGEEMKERETRAQTRAKKRKKRVAPLTKNWNRGRGGGRGRRGFSSGKNGRRAKEKIKGKRFV